MPAPSSARPAPVVPVRLDRQPPTLLDCARNLLADSPERTALTLILPNGTQTVSTRAFFEGAARYARALECAGVQPGDLVVLVLQHGPEVLYSFWGAMLLGAVPSIMPFLTPKLDPERYYDSVRQLVALSEVKAVITYPDMEPTLRAHLEGIPTLGAILSIAELEPGGHLADYLDRAPSRPEDTAFLQHSSGSTGLQKGVMLSHGAVLNQIAAYSAAIALRPDDVIHDDASEVKAEVVAKAVQLRDQGKTHMEVCEALNDLGFRTRTGELWQHPQQIVKLLRSFDTTR